MLNAPSRSWDLDTIISAISSAKTFVNIHVMDYIPMFVYGKNKTLVHYFKIITKHNIIFRYWPVIDNAIRSSVMRGVNVKIIASALHYPKISLGFLNSLESLREIPGAGTVDVVCKL